MIADTTGRWSILACTAVVLALGVRAVDHANDPAFEIALPAPRGVHFELDDVELLHPVLDGLLRVRAGRVRPGHERIGYFRLGPSTFVLLLDLEVVLSRSGEDVWRVRAHEGRLRSDTLRCDGPVTVDRDGRVERHSGLVVSLNSGRYRTH